MLRDILTKVLNIINRKRLHKEVVIGLCFVLRFVPVLVPLFSTWLTRKIHRTRPFSVWFRTIPRLHTPTHLTVPTMCLLSKEPVSDSVLERSKMYSLTLQSQDHTFLYKNFTTDTPYCQQPHRTTPVSVISQFEGSR